MKLQHNLIQQLNQRQLLNIEILQMSAVELDTFIQELAQENPTVELDEPKQEGEVPRDNDLMNKLRWLEDNDVQNRYYQEEGQKELDPVAQIASSGGLEETLHQFICRQLVPTRFREKETRNVQYLAACLDNDGYLRVPTSELAENLGVSEEEVEKAADMLRTLEPAGVGASCLAQCLELQLLRIHETGPAMKIVREHLELLAKHQYGKIAALLKINLDEVYEAEKLIRELEPRPGAVFDREEMIQYILPDVYVEERNGQLVVALRSTGQGRIRISEFYWNMLNSSDDPEVKMYLSKKLSQAKGVIYALRQREDTLLRCARVIVDNQRKFFLYGPNALIPLSMTKVAQDLELHESTVSRAVREKYIQCNRGVFPMSYFFVRNVSAREDAPLMGSKAAQSLMKKIIGEENPEHPLSDQLISEVMEERGCPISRRTVSKYRRIMNIPGAFERKEIYRK